MHIIKKLFGSLLFVFYCNDNIIGDAKLQLYMHKSAIYSIDSSTSTGDWTWLSLGRYRNERPRQSAIELCETITFPWCVVSKRLSDP
jgi:hypothetical protein